MEARVLLLESTAPDRRKILIDVGIGSDFNVKYGEKLGPKFAEMYGMTGPSRGASANAQAAADDDETTCTSIEKNLNSLGIKASEITDVILTHLHFDHAGGATCVRSGRLVPTFQNARYYIQRRNLETAQKPNLREKASYYTANFEALIEHKVLQILDGAVENLLPGVSVATSDGHTQGQQIVRVSDGETTLVYCADLIPTSSHVKLPWVMGYDLDPLKLIEEKRETLTRAAEHRWYLFFEHDPYADAAQVAESKGDFVVTERFSLA